MNRSLTTAASAVAPSHTVIPARAGTLLLSHTAVDVYAFFVPPLIGVPFRVQIPEGTTIGGHVTDSTDA